MMDNRVWPALNWGRHASIACIQLGPRKLSVMRSSGVSAIQGLVKCGSEWKDSQNCPLNLGRSLLRSVS